KNDKIISTQGNTNFKNSNRTGALPLVSSKHKTSLTEVLENKKIKLVRSFSLEKQHLEDNIVLYTDKKIIETANNQAGLTSSVQYNNSTSNTPSWDEQVSQE